MGNEVAEGIRNGTSIANIADKEQFTRYKKYFGDKVPNNVEDFVKMKYNNLDEWEYLKNRYQDAKLSYKIKNEYNLKINVNKFNKHIVGTKEYQQYLAKNSTPSVLNIDIDEAQDIINKYAGSGVKKRIDGVFQNKEIIDCGKNMGYVIDNKRNKVQTTKATIHYSKTGTHLVLTLRG